MKELEQALMNLPKPQLQVTHFKRSLRRELLHASVLREPAAYKWGFALSTMLAACFGTLLFLFVMYPAYPAKIRQMAGFGNGESVHHQSGQPVAGTSLNQPANHPVSRPVTGLLPPLENDSAFLQELVGHPLTGQQVKATPLRNEKNMNIREFRYSNGQRFIIFRELDHKAPQAQDPIY